MLKFCQEKKICYTGEEKVFDDLWNDAGIKIYFPRASLDKSIEVSVKVVTDIDGLFIPEEHSSTAVDGKPKKWFTPITQASEGFMPVVSAMYKITASSKLPLPITLQVQHCAVIENEPSLRFIVSHDEHPPYRFMQLDQGDFSSAMSGKIEMSDFCILGILQDLLGWYISLCFQVFYFQDSLCSGTTKVHLVLTKNLPAHIQYVREQNKNMTEVFDKALPCKHSTKAITLAIPGGNESYRIKPMSTPTIIDMIEIMEYRPGMSIPQITLMVKWDSKRVTENTDGSLRIGIHGGSGSMNSILLNCKPPSPVPGIEEVRSSTDQSVTVAQPHTDAPVAGELGNYNRVMFSSIIMLCLHTQILLLGVNHLSTMLSLLH